MKVIKRALRFPSEFLTLPKQVKIISLIVLIYYLGWGIAEAFLPIYFKQILQSYTNVGIVIGLFSLFTIPFSLFFGYIVDKISNKKIIAFSLIIYLPFSYILLSLQTLSQFLIFRIYHAFSASGFWTSVESNIRKHSPKRKTSEVIALHDVSYTIPLIIGPVIGGLLIIKFGFNIFYAISLFAILAIIPVLFLKEHKKQAKINILKPDIKKEFKDFLKNKQLIKFSFLAFFIALLSSFIFMILPLFLIELGANYLQIGIICSLFFLPILTEPFFSVLADKKSKKLMILIGLFLSIIFFFSLFFVRSILTLFIGSFLLSTAFSILRPALQGHITNLMPTKIIGELTGITRSILALAAAIGPITAGLISDSFGLKWVFLLASFISLAMLIYTSRLKFR